MSDLIVHDFYPFRLKYIVKYIFSTMHGDVIGYLQQTITWYKICRAGRQAHFYFRTRRSKQRQVKLH